MTVSCFMLEPTDRGSWSLRRYTQAHSGGWTCAEGWHSAEALIGALPIVRDAEGYMDIKPETPTPHEDPRWPASCAKGCGYTFTADDAWQDFTEALYRRGDTGEMTTIRDAPDGAMWDAFWYPWKGPDGRSLVAKCPGGHEWMIDGRASNCSLPNDTQHRCWVRHGEPPRLTVDKNGLTCAAGAGSILAGNYHGFLRDGAFT